MRFLEDPVHVPCGDCTICCKVERVNIHPEHGDRLADYKIVPSTSPGQWMLKRRTDGSCFYFDGTACTIYEKRPILCRIFDCRDVLDLTKRQIQERLDRGATDQRVLDRARELVKMGEAKP